MKKIAMLFLAVICIGLVSSFINFSGATEYYEWVQNGGFERYVNYFEDSGAESNAFNSGVQYGNFSGQASVSFSLNYHNSGVRSFYFTGSTNVKLWYNLTEPIIGADIINASVYASYFTNNNLNSYVYYSDGTYDSFYVVGGNGVFILSDFVSYINNAKYVVAFLFDRYNGGGYNFALDDFVLYDVDDDAQYYVGYNTEPWYEPQIWNVDIYQSITSGQKYSGNWSYHDWILSGEEGYVYQGGVPITQSFIGLDSDLINDFRLYAITDNLIEITVMFLYSDETYSTDSKGVNATTWTLYVFDVAVPNKVLVGFRITPYSTGQQFVNMNIDDVSLTATTPFIATEVTDSDHDGIPDQFDTVDDEEWLDEDEEIDERTNNLIDWIVMFIVIFMPALLFAGALYEGNKEGGMNISPVFGIIAGLILSVGLGVYTSLVPLWMLILMIIAVVLLIVGMVRR